MSVDAVWGTSEFTHGQNIAVVGHAMIALVESGNDQVRERLWALTVADAGVAAVLDDLSSAGLMSLPSFAIARFDGPMTTVVVRGDVVARVNLSSGETNIIDASGVSTWREEKLTDVATVELFLHEPQRDAPIYDVLAGSVPADWIRRDLLEVHELASQARDGWTSGHSRQVVRDAQILSDTAAAVEPTLAASTVEESLDVAIQLNQEPASADSQPLVADVEPGKHSDEPETVGTADKRDQTAALPEDDLVEVSDPSADLGRTISPDSSLTMSGDMLDGLEPGPAASSGSDYDSIYGHTVHRSVEDAAVRELPLDGTNEIISAVPRSSESAVETHGVPNDGLRQVAHGATEPGDHDGMTLSRSQLEEMQQVVVPGSDQVAAVMCPGQHPNPLHSVHCRVCGQPILSSTAVSIARPPLGVLVFSTGVRVVIDRSILIGRNPKVTGTVAGEFPHVVKFDEQGYGLSRTHAEITLEGWQILVSDLHSTNGTEVQLPGQSSRRLHPGEPIASSVGTTLDFGDGLTASIENVP